MVAVEGSCFIVQKHALLNDDDDDNEETLESMLKVQSSWRRLGDEKRCQIEGFPGNDSQDIFPLDIDGYFYDSFSYDSTDILS